MPIATRLTTAGTLLVNGSFDENTSIAPSKFRTTSNTVFASEFDEFTGAPVVDSSLKLWLDAAQTTSYPGTGTTWTDLSGNGNNGTLVNSPSFISTDGGGCIQLDGTNDHITLPTTGFAPASLTIDYWIKRISDEGYIWVIDNSDQPELRMIFQSGKLQIYFYDDGAYFSTALSTTTFSTGSWYNITATLTNGSQNVYINGNQEILTTTGTYTGNPGGNAGEHTLGTYNRPGAGYGGYANVRIGSYKFYNRVLTAAEITQNYNALQSRYGLASITTTQMPVVQRQQSSGTLLVNGEFDEFTGAPIVDSSLKLWLDAAQTTSYPGTGTTWTDLSGSGFNGTLTSGPTFSSADGGSIVFDGTDDYVDTGVINLISGTSATVEVWVNCGSSQNQYANILDYNHSNFGFVIQQDSFTLNTFYFAYWNGGSYDVTPTITLPTNTWCQLVFTKSGTSTVGYLNSVNTVSLTGSVNFTGTGLALALGRWLGGAGRAFNGKISTTRIYNRALTADEISTNFNALRNRYGI